MKLNTKALCSIGLALAVVACGPATKFSGDDDATDTVEDTGTEGHTDVALDEDADVPADTVADTADDPTPDTSADTSPDTTPDTSPDTTPDTSLDTSPDTTPDTTLDTTPDDVPVEPGCGNGVTEGTEECDDGNDSNNDECLNDCTLATCNDGFIWLGHEECEGAMVQSCPTTCGSVGTQDCTDCEWNPCEPPAESCNGLDDDCDTLPDEDFGCVLGSPATACYTACGTAGMRDCLGDCTLGECCAPAEVCGNGCDDDCNGLMDDGCSSPPPNDTCAGAIDVTAGGKFFGDTTHAASDSAGASGCTGSGPDVYFTFTLTDHSDVFISTHGTGFDTVLYVDTTCGGTAVACDDDSDAFGSSNLQTEIQLDNLAPGTYWITLDGYYSASSFGPYVMDFYISPVTAPGNRCGDPLPFNANSVAGGTCSLTDVFAPGCSSTGAPDVVYFFLVEPGSTGTPLSFTTCNVGTTFDTVLTSRSVCNDGATEIACNDDDTACMSSVPGQSRISGALAPGLYFLTVDGAVSAGGGDCGAYTVDATGL